MLKVYRHESNAFNFLLEYLDMITINGIRVQIGEGETRDIKSKETLDFIRRIVEHCDTMGSAVMRTEYQRGFRDAIRKSKERLNIMAHNLDSLRMCE
jgi:hypothetical protein